GFVAAQSGAFTLLDGSSVYAVTLGTSQDGGIVHFEQAEADRLRGDVVIRDRRGTITNPSTGPDPAWQEVYGPDWVSSETDGRFAADVPVLENGRCRVTYDPTTNAKGFRIEVASSGAWAEQGKVVVLRTAAGGAVPDTFVSAQVMEWTPERGVIKVVLRVAAD